MSLRNLLFSLGLLLIGLLAANSLSAQAYSFRVLKENPTEQPNPEEDPEGYEEWEPYLPLGDNLFRFGFPMQSGVPFEVRLEVLDGDGEIFTNYNGDVTLEVRGNFGEVSGWPPPPESPVLLATVENGVAEPVTVYPAHGGTENMRFWATDGNIITDNASGFFSIAPAGYEVSYVGGSRGLGSYPVVRNRDLHLRVRAVNDDGSTATGYLGFPQLSVNSVDPEAPGWIHGNVSIAFGGRTDDVRLNLASLGVPPGDGYTIGLRDGSIVGLETEDASGAFDVVDPGGGAALTLDNIEWSDNNPMQPRRGKTLRYRLDNGTDNPVAAPIDTQFRLMHGNNVVLQWIERYLVDDPNDPGNLIPGDIPDGENSGNLFTSFTIPGHLHAGDYRLEIRPGYAVANMETEEISLETLPDLAIDRLEYPPGDYRGGDAVRFNLTFSNLSGYGNSPNTWTTAVPHDQAYRVQIHLSTNANYGDGDDFLLWQSSFRNVGSRGYSRGLFGRGPLAPGQTVDVDAAFLLPENFEGTYYLLARINSAGGVDGTGFSDEHVANQVGNNTTTAMEAQKITILPRQGTDTFRVSLTGGGGQSGGVSDNPVVSRDGRFIAFESFGTLAGNSGSGLRNIFVRNVEGSDTMLVSASMSGAPNGHSGHPSISSSGRFVAFHSTASNLVAGDTNGYSDIFIRDVSHGITRRLSVNPVTGQQANNGSQLARISMDGRFVVFESSATNLLPPGHPAEATLSAGVSQIYLYDRDVGNTGVFDSSGNTAVSLVSQGGGESGWVLAPATGQKVWTSSTDPRISSDGSFVTFSTRATNILGQPSPFPQIVRWSRQTGNFTVVSVDHLTGEFGNNISGYSAINLNGEYVAFASRAQNMTPHFDPDTGEGDLYAGSIPHLFRARIQNGAVTEVLRMNAADGSEPNNPSTDGSPSNMPDLGAYEPTISEDGMLVAFTSESNNLLPAIPVHNLDRTSFMSDENMMFLHPVVAGGSTTVSEGIYNHRDDNAAADVYLYDLTNPVSPKIRRASVSRFGYETTRYTVGAMTVIEQIPVSRRPAISPDGRFIAFTSDAKNHHGLIFGATNYIYQATNGVRDVYVFDLKRGLVVPGDLPSISLLMPGTLNAIAGTTLALTAKATTDIGELDRVEFFANNTLVGTVGVAGMDSWNQFTLNWQIPVVPGNPNPQLYNVVAIAVSSNGVRSEISNLCQVQAFPHGQQAPTVTIISPEQPDTGSVMLTNRSVWPFAATAVGQGLDIAQVEFYLQRVGDPGRGILMGTAVSEPDHDAYRLNFDLDNLPSQFAPFTRLPTGNYFVTAFARDEQGNLGQSASVPVSVSFSSNVRPTVASFTVNKNEAALSEPIRFDLTVADPVGQIADVSLYGNGVLLATMQPVPNVQQGKFWSWDGQINVPGVWNTYAVVTDSSGNTTVSESIQVTVARALLRLDVAERVNLGDSVAIELEILAGNPVIGWVEFYVDGSFLQTDFNSPYVVNWAPQAVGTYLIEARAWDTEFQEFLNAPPVLVQVVEPIPPPVFSWQTQTSNTSAHLYGVTHFSGRFVAVGEGGTVLTSEGGGWMLRSTGVSQALRAVAGGDGILVAVGDSGRIVTSDDTGSTWALGSSGTSRHLFGVAQGMVDGAQRFVAVGRSTNGGVIRLSENGLTWSLPQFSTDKNLRAVAYGVVDGVGKFVAVGDDGAILTSTNGGLSWSGQPAVTSADLHGIAFGDGLYVAVGGRWSSGSDSARILTSSDGGATWTVSGSEIPSILHGVHFSGSAWVTTGSGGEIAASTDGFAWALNPDKPTVETLQSVSRGGGAYVAVGRNGVIVRSETNFQQWLADQFSTGDLANPSISGPEADPDGTGVSNLVRYALGIESAADARARLPRAVSLSNPGEPYLALRYTRSKKQDVLYAIEVSSDLNVWQPIEAVGGTVEVVLNGDTEIVTGRDGVSMATGDQRRFLRLRLELLE